MHASYIVYISYMVFCVNKYQLFSTASFIVVALLDLLLNIYLSN